MSFLFENQKVKAKIIKKIDKNKTASFLENLSEEEAIILSDLLDRIR